MPILPTTVVSICAYIICCFSNWCGLYLSLSDLMGLQGRAGHGEDLQVHGVVWQSGSWRYRIQCVAGMGAQTRVMSLT